MQLEILLKGEEPIFMGDGNLYRLTINQEITVHFRSFDGESIFYLYSKICELPNGGERKQILERLMEAHLFGQESGGAYFAHHHKTNALLLMMTFDSDVATYQQLQSRLQTFVEFLEYWKGEFNAGGIPRGEREDLLKAMGQKKKRIFLI